MPTTIKLTDEQTQRLDRIKQEQGFEYRQQAMDYVLGIQKDKKEEQKQQCEHATRDGRSCGRFYVAKGIFKPTSPQICELCMKELGAVKKLEDTGLLITKMRNEIIYDRNHINDLERQVRTNTDLITLNRSIASERDSLKNALVESYAKIDMLNASITSLNTQIIEMGHDTLFQENQLLKVQLGEANYKIENLKREIEKEIALQEKQAHAHNEEISSFQNALSDMKRFIPASTACTLCVSGFETLDYIKSVSKQIEKLQAHITPATS